MTPFLVADCVSKSYGDTRVLSSASLRAVPGELRALLGANGAGKSTLLRIACGIIAPDTGTVRVGTDVRRSVSLPQLARQGLFYWPDRNLLSNRFTLRAQLEFLRMRFDGGSVGEAAERVAVTSLLDQRPASFSGGERRRAEVAAVLVRRPRCLFADEPYRGIDPLDAEQITARLRELTDAGVAVVATGHEVPTLLAAANYVTWCTSGTTRELGPPSVARTNDQFCREYRGSRFSAWKA